MVKDEKLHEWYITGWMDEFSNNKLVDWFPSDIEKVAYMLGREYATNNTKVSLEERIKEIYARL